VGEDGVARGGGDGNVDADMVHPGTDVLSIDTVQTLTAMDSAPLVVGPPPCCTDTPLLPPASLVDPQCATCSTRPPPAPSESTTLCAQAFVMISQVNYRNVDAVQVRAWLGQGYRRAGREGEGCSVENSVLWRVLDYISST
jgi:hypothetical protein